MIFRAHCWPGCYTTPHTAFSKRARRHTWKAVWVFNHLSERDYSNSLYKWTQVVQKEYANLMARENAITTSQKEIACRVIPLLLLSINFAMAQNASRGGAQEFHVGVILDLGSMVGKIAQTSISLAMEDFYAVHQNYSTKLALHIRDSMSDDVRAASQGTCSELLPYVHWIWWLVYTSEMDWVAHSIPQLCIVVFIYILIHLHSAALQISGHGWAYMHKSCNNTITIFALQREIWRIK